MCKKAESTKFDDNRLSPYLNVITCVSPSLCKIRMDTDFLVYGKSDINHHRNLKTGYSYLFDYAIRNIWFSILLSKFKKEYSEDTGQ